MDQFELAEFAKNSENKEGSDFTPAVQEAGIEQGSLIVSRLYNTMLGSITRVMKNWSAEISRVITEAGLTPSALSEEQLYNAIITLINKNSYGCQMGDLIPNIGTVSPLGRVLCNGQRLSDCKTMFPDFYDYVVNNTPYKTLAEFNTQVSIYGQCGYCAVDGDDVLVPLITRPISGVSNISQTGQALNATSDKHVHGFGYNTYNNNGTFLFSTGIINVVAKFKKWIEWNGSGSSHGTGNTDTYGANMVTSEPYGAPSEPRGKQVQYPYYIQIYSAVSESMANVGELVDLLKYQNQVGITSITSTSGTVSLASGGLYSMQIDGDTTFSLPTPADVSNLNQIFMQLHIAATAVIDWGTDSYFNEAPSSDIGYSNVVWEYDVIQSKWIVGQILKV